MTDIFPYGWASKIYQLKDMDMEELFDAWLEFDGLATFDEFVQAVSEYAYNDEKAIPRLADVSHGITQNYGIYILPPINPHDMTVAGVPIPIRR